MIVLREARKSDQRQILKLARQLDSTNLPTEGGELALAIERSTRSFRGRIRARQHAVYLFCAEDPESGRVVGASMIIAKHGTPESPHYYLEMDFEERYSQTLDKMMRQDYLLLRHSMDGPTEIGGLIVDPAMRGHPEKIGKQLSWVRFLYMGRRQARFESRLIAEMLSPLLPDGSNLFWDHYGRRVTGLSFREADKLSIRDKEFIRALFPEAPLYTFLLPDNVRASLGAVGEQSRGAVRLLEQAGMKFLRQIDPFDGGPYYGATLAETEPVKSLRAVRVRCARDSRPAHRLYLLAHDDLRRGFRAVQAAGVIEGELIFVPRETVTALHIKEGTRVDTVPLP